MCVQTGTALLHISFIYCLPHNREIKRIRLFLLFLSQQFHVFYVRCHWILLGILIFDSRYEKKDDMCEMPVISFYKLSVFLKQVVMLAAVRAGPSPVFPESCCGFH